MTLIWTYRARQCLREIREYISKDSPLRAGNFIRQIIEKAEVLSGTPRIGTRPPELDGSKYLQIFHGHYRIIYEIVNKETIHIHGVIHTRRDFNRLRDDF
jgi:plasmid stabilization system protein ParE